MVQGRDPSVQAITHSCEKAGAAPIDGSAIASIDIKRTKPMISTPCRGSRISPAAVASSVALRTCPGKFEWPKGTRDLATEPNAQSLLPLSGPVPKGRNKMKISEIMSTDVRLVRFDQHIRDAAAIMAEIDVGSVPVATSERLVGMITDRDIAIRAVGGDRGPSTAWV
jgi:hypothetical protein